MLVIGDIVEDKIEKWVLDGASRGFPIIKNSLLFAAQSFIKSLPSNVRKTLPFKDKPGSSWWRNFLIRHPVVKEKKTEYTKSLKVKPTEERIRQWFSKAQIMMDADGILNVLSDPSRLFCIDEIMLWLNPDLVDIFEENEELIKNRDERDYVTVCFTICADGSYAPPSFIFKSQRLPAVYNLSCPEGWNVDCTMSGTSTCESFLKYISEIFLPYLIKKEIERPIVLFMNGNASYHSLPLTNFCRENGINLVSFPPWATHILQPLHGSYTKSLKLRWREILKKHTVRNTGEVKKYEVPVMFKNLLDNYNVHSTTIQNRFEKCGLYPFDPESVAYERCQPHNEDDCATDEICPEEIPILSRRTFMDVFEGAMQPELLAEFRHQYHENGTWTGDVRQAGFFDFWVKMHKEEAAFYQEDANGTFLADTNKSYIESIGNIDLMTEDVELIVHGSKMGELQESDITLDSANVTYCEYSTVNRNESIGELCNHFRVVNSLDRIYFILIVD